MNLSGPPSLVALLDALGDDELDAEVRRRELVREVLQRVDSDERTVRLLLDELRRRDDAGSVAVRHEVDDAGEPRAVRQPAGPDCAAAHRHHRAELERLRTSLAAMESQRDAARAQRDALGEVLGAVEEALRG